jgi:hypothetical protein
VDLLGGRVQAIDTARDEPEAGPLSREGPARGTPYACRCAGNYDDFPPFVHHVPCTRSGAHEDDEDVEPNESGDERGGDHRHAQGESINDLLTELVTPPSSYTGI